jgi:putative oxidoreductase
MCKALVRTDDDLASFVLRVMLGAVFFPHGAQKVLGWFGGYGFSGTMGFLTGHQGLPYALALMVIAGEFLGSIGLIVGCLTRVAAFGIACIMVGAIYTVHVHNGFFMNWEGKQAGEGFEYHLLVLAIAVSIMMRGAGKWSIDRALSKS